MKYRFRFFRLLQALILLFISNESLAFGRGRLGSMNDNPDCRVDDFSNEPPSLINRYDPPGRIPLPEIEGHPYFPAEYPSSMRSKGTRYARKSRRTLIDYYPYSRLYYPVRWEDYDD